MRLVDLSPSRLRVSSILLVEDSPADAACVHALVKDIWGTAAACTTVGRLFDAVDLLRRRDETPACVLLDLTLPDADGIESVETLLATAPDIPVVALAGDGDERLGELALGCGAKDFLTKRDLSGPVLARALRYAVDRNSLQMQLRDVEARATAATRALDASNRTMHMITETANDAFVSISERGIIDGWNHRAEQMFGWSRAEAIGRALADTIVPEHLRAAHLAGLERFLRTGKGAILGRRVELTARHRDGHEVPAELTVCPVDGYDGTFTFCAFVRDVGERKLNEQALADATQRFQRAFDSAPIGMAVVGLDETFMEVNPTLQSMLGYVASELQAMKLRDVIHPEDVEPVLIWFERLHSGVTSTFRTERRLVGRERDEVWVVLSAVSIDGPDGRPAYVIVELENTSERKAAEAALVHQTMHDDLTGLPNRFLLRDRLEHALARASRRPGTLAVLFLDVDRFKLINDTLGHKAGDQLLLEVAQRLQAAVRPADTVARLGGDEFVVVVDDIANEADAIMMTERIRAACASPIRLEGGEVVPSVSIGLALATDGHHRPEQLLREADTAMYRAKELGKDRFEIFDDALRVQAVARLGTETLLRRALDEDRMIVLYQPIVDLQQGLIVGAEALLRIDDPEQGIVLPDDFIHVAEETGLIVPLGRYVLETAMAQLDTWIAKHPAFRMTINLSVRQLGLPTLVEDVAALLDRHAQSARHVSLEITETVLMDAGTSTVRSLEGLRRLGVGLGIDDFGTGYSSLAYLHKFPIDFLKIDRSFVAGATTRSEDAAIVRAVIGLARGLGLTCVAEGVESREQVKLLCDLDCDLAQGFYFAAPQPAATIEALFTELQQHDIVRAPGLPENRADRP